MFTPYLQFETRNKANHNHLDDLIENCGRSLRHTLSLWIHKNFKKREITMERFARPHKKYVMNIHFS